MAAAIGAGAFCPTLAPTQHHMRRVARVEALVIGIPATVFELRTSAVERIVASLALEISFLRKETAVLALSSRLSSGPSQAVELFC